MSTDLSAVDEWKRWHEQRVETVSGPHGPLSLVGTHWLADYPEGQLPAIPGQWTEDGEEVVLRAAADDGLLLDGRPFAGEVRLGTDGGASASRVVLGERRLMVMRREGAWAVRDFDPASPARRAFQGIEATPYDADWSLPGRFSPYGSENTIQVENADGRARGLGLGGELAFQVGGVEHTLQATVEADGSLWAVFADASSGQGSYRFRFLRTPAPGADGRVTVDFNRVTLPPCAFADHFICPFPPPGNTLGFAVEAGERNLDGRSSV
ncbi:DUF1684 domain-containing protein [Streptomyces sp. TRM66268-LWL]|uniref:DUF1684 domain-containing protein n=1 Tax=Streptomyces polyasparticus TaxID=2767826 RepID=A0ABR7SKS8_9ACTN|nr:DUF1684 domain-containing protein [Streptomyces polyasparticus]MBC9715315.1 DUF1684 domain-containing protein [Streptomyces polyasparticus]